MLMGLWVLWLESSEATITKKYVQKYTYAMDVLFQILYP